jgi:hypothetical protein
VSTQLLNQRLSERRKVRKSLYRQNCVKGFLKMHGLKVGGGKGGSMEMVEVGVEEEEGDSEVGGGRERVAMTARKKQQMGTNGHAQGRRR